MPSTTTAPERTERGHDGDLWFHIYGPEGDPATDTLVALCGFRRPPRPEVVRPMVRGAWDCPTCWEIHGADG